jgi:hypothetical protein
MFGVQTPHDIKDYDHDMFRYMIVYFDALSKCYLLVGLT